jgi:hypothetical protein
MKRIRTSSNSLHGCCQIHSLAGCLVRLYCVENGTKHHFIGIKESMVQYPSPPSGRVGSVGWEDGGRKSVPHCSCTRRHNLRGGRERVSRHSKRFTTLPPKMAGGGMSQRRLYSASAVYNGTLCVVGGRDPAEGTLRSVEVYDFATQQWSPPPDRDGNCAPLSRMCDVRRQAVRGRWAGCSSREHRLGQCRGVRLCHRDVEHPPCPHAASTSKHLQ